MLKLIVQHEYLKNFCKSNKHFKILKFLKKKSFSETKLSALKSCQKFKFIFDIDGNMAHDTNSIKKFKKKIFQYKYDAVCGSRFLKNWKIYIRIKLSKIFT